MTARSKTATRPPKTEIVEPIAHVDLGPLPGFVGYVLRRAQLAVFQDFVQTMATLDIRPAQYSVLLVIARNPGVNQTQISDALGIKTANLVVMLNSLQARGLTERRPGSTDRRAHALFLTAGGRAAMQRLDKLQGEHERRIIAKLGPDGARVLLQLLAKLV
jgi:DNA-binding MarR family transcriptional regulator